MSTASGLASCGVAMLSGRLIWLAQPPGVGASPVARCSLPASLPARHSRPAMGRRVEVVGHHHGAALLVARMAFLVACGTLLVRSMHVHTWVHAPCMHGVWWSCPALDLQASRTTGDRYIPNRRVLAPARLLASSIMNAATMEPPMQHPCVEREETSSTCAETDDGRHGVHPIGALLLQRRWCRWGWMKPALSARAAVFA